MFNHIADLSWQKLGVEDLEALTSLARSCYQADGGLSFLFEPDILRNWYFPEVPGTAIGAFAPDGRLIACESIYVLESDGGRKAKTFGLVRPDQRNKGIGSYLLQWSLEQGHSLLAGDDYQNVLQIQTESLTVPAERLYQKYRFEKVFEELVMRMDFDQPLTVRSFPEDVTITRWEPELGEQFYHAYDAAFKQRPGFPGWSVAEWIEQVTEDDFKSEWSLLAKVGNKPVGFVIGNIDLTTDPPGAHLWQVGVIPAQRRRGIASGLMVESMRRMQADGASFVQLTVHTNNPGAIQIYTHLGYKTAGRRARFERKGL